MMEKTVVLSVTIQMKEKMLLWGGGAVDVMLTRPTDDFVGLRARANLSNNWGSDIFMSVHCNSAGNFAKGHEVWTTPGITGADELALGLSQEFEGEFPARTNRGLKEASFSVLRQTRCPAALYELEFIHFVEGEAFLGSAANQTRMAEALARGGLKYLGIEVSTVPREPARPAGPVSPVLVGGGRDDALLGERIAALREILITGGETMEQAGAELGRLESYLGRG